MTAYAGTHEFINANALINRIRGAHDSMSGIPYIGGTERSRTVGVFKRAGSFVADTAAAFVPRCYFLTSRAELTGIERLKVELGRLVDGWCGPGSLAPSREALRDLDALFCALDLGYEVPEIEVDEDTSYLTLRWRADGSDSAFSVILKGDGRALLIESKFAGTPVASSSTFSLDGAEDLARYISRSNDVYELLYD